MQATNPNSAILFQDQLTEGQHGYSFFKPVKIGTFILTVWKSETYADLENSYGMQIYEHGKMIQPKYDARFSGKNVFRYFQDCSWDTLVDMIQVFKDMFPDDEATLLEHY
eukprot:TRINITY_DN12995_c0_g1_i1.p1 TRINITY_DN12995_c0_g1~~TRINITY_DN12995_c0_g1_i1.p1  ORF type:complete len:110 (+),score=16.33 TRINITY_DN12995_c0_g1_i1:72-401(+)